MYAGRVARVSDSSSGDVEGGGGWWWPVSAASFTRLEGDRAPSQVVFIWSGGCCRRWLPAVLGRGPALEEEVRSRSMRTRQRRRGRRRSDTCPHPARSRPFKNSRRRFWVGGARTRCTAAAFLSARAASQTRRTVGRRASGSEPYHPTGRRCCGGVRFRGRPDGGRLPTTTQQSAGSPSAAAPLVGPAGRGPMGLVHRRRRQGPPLLLCAPVAAFLPLGGGERGEGKETREGRLAREWRRNFVLVSSERTALAAAD